jgi:cyclopropane-fatty-acyl-phospholipid synthase
MLLDAALRRLIRIGDLTVIDSTGRAHRYTGAPGYRSVIRLKDSAIERDIILRPDPAVGEAYMPTWTGGWRSSRATFSTS